MQLRTSPRNTMKWWWTQGGLTANIPPPPQARAHPRIHNPAFYTTYLSLVSWYLKVILAAQYVTASVRPAILLHIDPTQRLPWTHQELCTSSWAFALRSYTAFKESEYDIPEVTIRQLLLAVFILINLFTFPYQNSYLSVTREGGQEG